MRVTVVEMRATGMKLSEAELAEATVHAGELFIEGYLACLCGGDRPSEWPDHGRLLPALYDARVSKLRGDSFVVVGKYMKDGIHVHATVPQAWWVRLAQT